MRLALLSTAVYFLAAIAAHAAGDASRCQQIKDPAQRLHCYDDAAIGGDELLAKIALAELSCKRKPHTAEAVGTLVRAGLALPKPFRVADSLNFYSLQRPMKVDGLNVIAVFGYDETGKYPFVRSPGTSPGYVFGVVTKDDLSSVSRWRESHSKDLELDDSYSGIAGAKEISCSKLAGDD